MSWTDSAEKDAEGKFLKFKDGTSVEVLFTDEPERKMAESTYKKGERYPTWDFPVMVDGEPRILGVSNKLLMRLLVDEEKEGGLVGNTFSIKAIGDGKSRAWRVRRLAEKPTAQKAHTVEELMEDDDKAEAKKPKKKAKTDKEKFDEGLKEHNAKKAQEEASGVLPI